MSEYEQPFRDEDYERQAEEWDEFLRAQEERLRERLREDGETLRRLLRQFSAPSRNAEEGRP